MKASLILVRHAAPRIVESEAPTSWALSDEGRAAAGQLAERIRPFAPEAIVASPEPKADETARIIGEALRLSIRSDDGFVEHRRPGLGFVDTKTFKSSVREVFKRSSERLFGGESADEALARFDAAVARQRTRPLLVATHGTVLSLYVGRMAKVDAYEFWSSLKLPEAIIIGEDGRVLQRISV